MAGVDRGCGPASRLVRRLGIEGIDPEAELLLDLWSVLAAVSAVVIGIVAGVGALVAALVVAAGLPVAAVARLQRRRREQLLVELPEMLDALVRSLRSGSTLRIAIEETAAVARPGPMAKLLARIRSEVDRGRSLAGALAPPGSAATGPVDLATTLATLALLADDESGSAGAIEACSRSLRSRLALRGRVRSLVAQAELSMWVLVALPATFVVAGLASDRPVTDALLHTPFGRACLAAGVALDLVGFVWMRVLVRRVQR